MSDELSNYVKRVEKIKKELDGRITNKDELNVYIQFRLDGMAEVGAREMLNSFGYKELLAITRFRRFYSHYFPNEQAEQVIGYKETNKDLFLKGNRTLIELKELEKQNKRYREAIEKAVKEYHCGKSDASWKIVDLLVRALLYKDGDDQ